MRIDSWFSIAAWTVMMAVMCAFSLILIVLGGWGALAPGIAFATFAGGGVIWGWHAVKSRTRVVAEEPEALPVPEPVEGILTIRKTQMRGLVPILLFTAFAWCMMAVCVASAFGLVRGEGSVVAGLIIAGIFVLFGHSVLLEQAVTVRLDLRQGRWENRKGLLPIRFRQRGDLTEASHVAVARELRSDEGAEYEVLVARLAWRDEWHAPLVLGERPNDVDSLRYGGDTLKRDYRSAMTRWASGLAGVLNLPLMDETKGAP
jgi:hypothetical protein